MVNIEGVNTPQVGTEVEAAGPEKPLRKQMSNINAYKRYKIRQAFRLRGVLDPEHFLLLLLLHTSIGHPPDKCPPDFGQ